MTSIRPRRCWPSMRPTASSATRPMIMTTSSRGFKAVAVGRCFPRGQGQRADNARCKGNTGAEIRSNGLSIASSIFVGSPRAQTRPAVIFWPLAGLRRFFLGYQECQHDLSERLEESWLLRPAGRTIGPANDKQFSKRSSHPPSIDNGTPSSLKAVWPNGCVKGEFKNLVSQLRHLWARWPVVFLEPGVS